MTESKLEKFLSKPTPSTSGKRLQQPVILSDSKGKWLQREITNEADGELIWWSKSGAKIEDSTRWLRTNIARKIIQLRDVWLYVWLGTCNLTAKNKKYISLKSETDEEILRIEKYYKEIIKIVDKYPGSKITILEIPLYSIKCWNQNKGHKNPSAFEDQDTKLEQQILKLNTRIRTINASLGNHSPSFTSDIYKTSKIKSGSERTSKLRKYYNFNLLADGIHPGKLVAKVWLKKISDQTKRDCWQN
ncbi:hypothetical protein FSP39_015731 [Pinctada imbricata]|uniref:Uncharacterized protein n=1 Tax=Pinctada imbricata TaxID=66713 RepID=A0AA88YEI5_PINIB|nr:hypothetical protein FSP39_015731 [Pinctada imbricata]